MTWVVGIDEAGYGPNLGPFVMTAVACEVGEGPGADLWRALRPAVRRGGDEDDGRLLVDDSKLVYSTARGLLGLELGVLAALWRGREGGPAALSAFLEWACPEAQVGLCGEAWYRGTSALPVRAQPADLAAHAARFDRACARAGIRRWLVRGVVVCTPHFNALLAAHDSKGAVLAHALTALLRAQLDRLPGDEPLAFFVDKHGGRNTYAALIQHALPGGLVVAGREEMAGSSYRVLGLGREVRLTFEPRADATHLGVALASMASKYLRELLMLEFNRFWQEQVPGLKATAGYPGDAARFLAAIRPAAERLGIGAAALWRRK
jgi:hypothetical protein